MLRYIRTIKCHDKWYQIYKHANGHSVWLPIKEADYVC